MLNRVQGDPRGHPAPRHSTDPVDDYLTLVALRLHRLPRRRHPGWRAGADAAEAELEPPRRPGPACHDLAILDATVPVIDTAMVLSYRIANPLEGS